MDYLADIRVYDKSADEETVNKLVKRYAAVLAKKDSANVAASDPKELETVRKNFVEAKLGISDKDAGTDAINKVAAMMKGDRTKNRATFYYLVAKELNKLDVVKAM